MYAPTDDTCPIPGFYDSFAPPAPECRTLEGTHKTGVVVVGAGFTGLSTALHLAERGVEVIVLDAKAIGWGASSRNFGQVVPYFKHDWGRVLGRFGSALAERLIAAAGAGPDLVYSVIARHGIDCSAVRKGLIFAAHSPEGRAGLERRTEFWRARGASVEMVEGRDAEALIGTRFYEACSLDRRGGTINPLAYVRGLARAALGLGVRIHAPAPVTSLARDGSRWRLATPDGEVRADTVVLATNAYTEVRLWPGLRQSLIPMRAYQLVSRPLGENLRRSILPQGQPLTDTRHLFSGVRLHHDGRLQASTDGPAFDAGGEPDVAGTSRRIAATFPQLDRLDWEYRWAGWVAMSNDFYPHLHALAPGLWAGLGYSGRGIALASLMGREIASRIAGVPESELVLPVTPLRPWVASSFARPLVGALMSYYRLKDRRADRRRRAATS